VGSTPCLLYIILCVVFEARVINLCDRGIATLSPQGPQWSRHYVTRVWRHGENIYPQNFILSKNVANVGKQEILVFYMWKNGMGVAT